MTSATTVLIVGASRGIGLEFVRQYAGGGSRVRATHRKPDDAQALRQLGADPIALDVCDEAAVAALAAEFAASALDLAILNAGVYGPRTEAMAAPGAADFDAVFHTNVRAAMGLLPLLAPALIRARGKIAVISSSMGSISRATSNAGWMYRASKAALNSVLKSASLELGPRGVVCMAIDPGWVRTDMGGAHATLEAVESVTAMRRVIDAANDSLNGKFLRYTGEQLAW